MAERGASSRVGPIALLGASAMLMLIFLAPPAIFGLGIGTAAVLGGDDATAADAPAPSGRRAARAAGSPGAAPAARTAKPEAAAAAAMASPMVAILRRLRELEADPKLSADGSALIGALREQSRGTEGESWADLRSRTVAWLDVVRSGYGTDAGVQPHLERIDTALAGAP